MHSYINAVTFVFLLLFNCLLLLITLCVACFTCIVLETVKKINNKMIYFVIIKCDCTIEVLVVYEKDVNC